MTASKMIQPCHNGLVQLLKWSRPNAVVSLDVSGSSFASMYRFLSSRLLLISFEDPEPRYCLTGIFFRPFIRTKLTFRIDPARRTNVFKTALVLSLQPFNREENNFFLIFLFKRLYLIFIVIFFP